MSEATRARDLDARGAARALAEHMASEDGSPSATEAAITELIRDAERNDWPEVARSALYAQTIRAAEIGDDAHLIAIARLLDRSLADGDVAMAATALAKRSRVLTRSDNPSSSVAADRDLAQASIMIEGLMDGGDDLARAHINCSIGYGSRDLWELEDEHYRAAEEALDRHGSQGRLRHVLLYNRAELQLNWAIALRELGEVEALRFRARAAAKALAAADVRTMPESWRDELSIFSAVLAAIAPEAAPAPGPLTPEGEYAGYVHLARALTVPDPASAAQDAEAAVASIDPDNCPNAYNLALCVAAEIESSLAGGVTAGLRYARHLAHKRWAKRRSRLAAMQSLLQAERMSTEHALLSQHAYLDDLTRLSNRRAMARYVEQLVSQGVSTVAIILLDVDRFKDVNDTYGHAVGDEVLIRLAGLLRAAVRSEDLAVRLGGDEFLLLLAASDADAMRRRAEAIHAAVDAEPWGEIAPDLTVRASVGVACGDPRLLDRVSLAADSALYRSKAAGGGRISES